MYYSLALASASACHLHVLCLAMQSNSVDGTSFRDDDFLYLPEHDNLTRMHESHAIRFCHKSGGIFGIPLV